MTINEMGWIQQDKVKQVLTSFIEPKTPRQVEKELGIKKLKMGPFLEKGLIESLNPDARKGRYYLLTAKARRLLRLPSFNDSNKSWDLVGWVNSSPLQRFVILRTIAIDSVKRTSEEIRHRASKLNPCLSRISTKSILKELVGNGLVKTEMNGRYRLYWICEKGRLTAGELLSMQPEHKLPEVV